MESYHDLERFTLVVGLALRDIKTVIEHDDDDMVPDWIKESPLKERELQKLLKLCPPKIIPQRNATAG
jgi:hypothetical protein